MEEGWYGIFPPSLPPSLPTIKHEHALLDELLFRHCFRSDRVPLLVQPRPSDGVNLAAIAIELDTQVAIHQGDLMVEGKGAGGELAGEASGRGLEGWSAWPFPCHDDTSQSPAICT